MNKDQKQAAADRLAAAREKRYAKNPPKYSQYCQEVVKLHDDDDFSMKNVRAWIKEAKQHQAAEHRSFMAGTNGALAKKETWKCYVSQLENYLRTGAYTSLFAGGDMEKRVSKYCIAMAYYENGKPKRELGTYYNDWMQVWTPELENEERQSFGMKQLKFNDKGHVLVQSSSKTVKKTTKKKRKPMTPAAKAAFVERMRKAREKRAK
jgi:hypothetical protein